MIIDYDPVVGRREKGEGVGEMVDTLLDRLMDHQMVCSQALSSTQDLAVTIVPFC